MLGRAKDELQLLVNLAVYAARGGARNDNDDYPEDYALEVEFETLVHWAVRDVQITGVLG